METILQRVSKAWVSVDGHIVGQIGQGLVVLLGAASGDTESDAKFLADKISALRIFADQNGKFNLSVQDVQGEILVVSQFTLLADTRKGRRPSFFDAAPPEEAESLIERFAEILRSYGLTVATGQFQAYMHVGIHNDGPVTIPLSTKR